MTGIIVRVHFEKMCNRPRVCCCPSAENGRGVKVTRSIAKPQLNVGKFGQRRIRRCISRSSEGHASHSFILNCFYALNGSSRIELDPYFVKAFNSRIAPCPRWHVLKFACPNGSLLRCSRTHDVPQFAERDGGDVCDQHMVSLIGSVGRKTS